MKKIKIGLLARIVIAIILGIAIGTFFPAPLVRIFVTFNGIFSEFLNFSIPLIIVGLVTVAIADIGKGAGKMLLVTALIAYFATLFSGFLSIGTFALRHHSVKGRGYRRVESATDGTERTDCLNIVTDTFAAATENTFIHVAHDGGSDFPFAGRELASIERHFADIKA